MRAYFDGECRGCDSRISVGDEIRKAGGFWVCLSCWEIGDIPDSPGEASSSRIVLAAPVKPGETMCTRCFTYHPGEC